MVISNRSVNVHATWNRSDNYLLADPFAEPIFHYGRLVSIRVQYICLVRIRFLIYFWAKDGTSLVYGV